MNYTRAVTAIVATVATVILGVGGCAHSDSVAESSGAEGASDHDWPRIIEIPAGSHRPASSVRVEAEPERIAALDYESGETLAALGLADRTVLIPEALLNPVLGGHVDEFRDVEATFPVAMRVDAETVINLAPDLVVTSPRHGNEASISAVLEQAGITTLHLPHPWNDGESLIANITLIGQATGGDESARALAEQIEEGIDTAGADVFVEQSARPRVIMLTNQAGQPFVTAGNAYPIELLELAGARNAAADLGIERTGPIGAEQLVEVAPDGIVLIDMNGSGDRMFAELMANRAVARIPAIEEGRILRIDGRQVQALGLTETVRGLAALTEWVAGL